jgi:5'-nucleotidase
MILVDAGDMFQGTLLSNLSEGQAVIRAMNALGYTAAAIGNHEFDFGPVGPNVTPKAAGDHPRGALNARIAEASFPLLSANLFHANDMRPAYPAFHVVTVDGVKVAIVGGVTEDLVHTTIAPNLVGLKVAPLGPSVATAARLARKSGAQIVIAVVHAGGGCPHRREPLDEKNQGESAACEDGELFRLAREVAARAKTGEGGRVDAIFGGHTHKSLHAVVEGIPVLQAGSGGTELARAALEVDDTGAATGRFLADASIEICSATVGGTCDPRRARGKIAVPARHRDWPIDRDARLDDTLRPDQERAAAARAAPVGVTLETPLTRAYASEAPLGNLVADVLRAAAGADLGLTNGGGIRSDLPKGPLTYGDLFEALPFDNRLATMVLDGATLRSLFARNFAHDRGILFVSGARVQARCAGGNLAIDITLSDGRVVEDKLSYRVATSDFLALGGDDFNTIVDKLPRKAVQIDERGMRDVVASALPKLGASLRADDPRWWGKERRLIMPSARPVQCAAASGKR